MYKSLFAGLMALLFTATIPVGSQAQDVPLRAQAAPAEAGTLILADNRHYSRDERREYRKKQERKREYRKKQARKYHHESRRKDRRDRYWHDDRRCRDNGRHRGWDKNRHGRDYYRDRRGCDDRRRSHDRRYDRDDRRPDRRYDRRYEDSYRRGDALADVIRGLDRLGER